MHQNVLENTPMVSKSSVILKNIKFIFVSYFISIILMAVFSLLMVYTDVSERYMGISVKVITFFSAFISGFFSGKTPYGRGFIKGIIIGGLNILGIIIIGFLAFDFDIITSGNIIKILLGMLFGMIGAMAGAMFKNE